MLSAECCVLRAHLEYFLDDILGAAVSVGDAHPHLRLFRDGHLCGPIHLEDEEEKEKEKIENRRRRGETISVSSQKNRNQLTVADDEKTMERQLYFSIRFSRFIVLSRLLV